jgi:GAF domain-containing protein
MNTEGRIDIQVIKVISRAIGESDNLEIMSTHLAQLLVGALGIRGSALFALNPESEELEMLASFGLSIGYLNKGPVLSDKSIAATLKGQPVVVADVSESDQLQYPEHAQEEGIAAIVSLPIVFRAKVIGSLRLYHHELWALSAGDLDALQLLADNIGLAMMYTRLLNAVQSVKETVNAVHDIWLHV